MVNVTKPATIGSGRDAFQSILHQADPKAIADAKASLLRIKFRHPPQFTHSPGHRAHSATVSGAKL